MRRRPAGLLSPKLLLVMLGHPELWLTAIRQAFRMVPNRWWASWPFLPIPDRGYMHFRLVTAYGGDGRGPIEPDDLVTYLMWCRSWPR